jgi:hypothetical protein
MIGSTTSHAHGRIPIGACFLPRASTTRSWRPLSRFCKRTRLLLSVYRTSIAALLLPGGGGVPYFFFPLQSTAPRFSPVATVLPPVYLTLGPTVGLTRSYQQAHEAKPHNPLARPRTEPAVLAAPLWSQQRGQPVALRVGYRCCKSGERDEGKKNDKKLL